MEHAIRLPTANEFDSFWSDTGAEESHGSTGAEVVADFAVCFSMAVDAPAHGDSFGGNAAL